MTDEPETLSGGCQCGAVRYRAVPMLESSHICHCRMCQKAAGNFFAALVGVQRRDLTWTRGTPASFASSADVTRGFCRDCGTPLFYADRTSNDVALTTGSLDDPARCPPLVQFGNEARVTYFAGLAALPDEGTTEQTMAAQVEAIRASNHQHPDHDTDRWPL